MSNYPTIVDDASSLYAPADAFSGKPLTSKLAVSCQANDTTLQLADGVTAVGGPAAYGIIRVDDEQILYTASSGGNITGCTRGFNGTTKVGHAAQTVVRWPYVAAFDQALQAAIIAVQNALGITGGFNFFKLSDWYVGTVPNGALKIGTGAYVGGPGTTFSILGFNAWYNNSAWTIPDAAQTSSVILFGPATIALYCSQTAGMSDFALQGEFSNSGFQLNAGGAVKEIVTTLGSPGSDSNLATEKAVRTAIGSGGGGALLYSRYTDSGSTSGTGATDLVSFAIPANTLAHDGDCLLVEISTAIHAAAANLNVSGFVLFGAGTYTAYDGTAVNDLTAGGNGWGISGSGITADILSRHTLRIIRASSSTARAIAEYRETTSISTNVTPNHIDTPAIASLDFTTSQNLVVRVTNSTGGSTATVKVRAMTVQFVAGP